MKKEKVVLILGNGFSMGFGFPSMKELWKICKKPANKNIQVSSFTESFPFSYFEEEGMKNIEIFLSLWLDYVNSLEDAYYSNPRQLLQSG